MATSDIGDSNKKIEVNSKQKLENCDRPTRLLFCVNVYSLPLEFGLNEYIFERFNSFVRDNGGLFVYLSQKRLSLY